MKKIEISIDGVDYLIDVSACIKAGVIKPKPKPFKHKSTGMRFTRESVSCGLREYILAFTQTTSGGTFVQLINLESGIPWTHGVKVKDVSSIDAREWGKICAGFQGFEEK